MIGIFDKNPKNRMNTEKSVFMRFFLSFILQKFLSFYKIIHHFKIEVHTKCTKEKAQDKPELSLMKYLDYNLVLLYHRSFKLSTLQKK